MDKDGIFDASVAATYDRDHGTDPETVESTALFLADLAAGGPALEFAIGTGRIALPLAALGIKVHGIERSRPMVTKLREKDGGGAIPVTIGDMTTTVVDGRFSMVYLVFNTLSNLTSQDDQVACFQNAARHLEPGGHFVVENAVPPLQRLPPGETRLAFARSDHHWGIDEFDVTTQTAVSHHRWFEDGRSRTLSVPFRYVWPSELDLMARIAGLAHAGRWGGWKREPFNAHTTSHVSIWQRPD